MKRPALLLTIALAPLAAASPVRSADDYWSGRRYYDAESLPYEGDASAGYIDSYGDPYLPLEALGPGRRAPGRWGSDPQYPPPSAWGDPEPYRAYPPSGGWAPGVASPGEGYPDAYSRGTSGPRELPPGGRSEYRFRGDERYGGAPGGPGFEADGYRFRPLTDIEQERIRRESGWWSRGPPERVGRSEATDSRPREGAIGYEPDNWFRRHYGERP